MAPIDVVSTEQRCSFSKLQDERLASRCIKPRVVLAKSVHVMEREALGARDHHDRIKALFPSTYGRPRIELVPGGEADVFDKPLNMGVVLSGGQAPGGHNVIAGVFDFAKKCSPDSKVFGFLNGPAGVMKGICTEITPELMDAYRNTGGFDMLGSGRDKIETKEQMEASKKVAEELNLDGLIVIGGDDSNTNAAILAEYFESSGCKTKVNGCPKTIDGDLKNEYVPISFGFDTAAKTFSEEIGNVQLDALASQKYYHFIRLMGRAASNIALECALQTRPNVCLISEEVEAKGLSLKQIVDELVEMILKRADAGKNYGVVMLPEGLIEFIPEFNALISDINDVLASGIPTTIEGVVPALQPANRNVFNYLPQSIKMQLLLDRDPHGNVQVAKIETEVLLAQAVEAELEKLAAEGKYAAKFAPQFHSFGYEGRCALPSHFDCSYCYALGYTAGALTSKGMNALMACANNLDMPIEDWTVGGVPITMMCHMERRKGKDKPVIMKALVELDGPRSQPFQAFAAEREKWMEHDMYRAPGAIQFYSEGARNANMTLMYELLGEKAKALTQCDLSETAAPEPVAMGASKFLFRPATKATRSHVERARLDYEPKVPGCLKSRSLEGVELEADERSQSSKQADRGPLERMFPSTYGARLLQVLGVVGGTVGLFEQSTVEVTDELLDAYRNQGGFDLLGRSRDSIRTEAELAKAKEACAALDLDGLVVIGGNTTATDAAYLSEYFHTAGLKTSVACVPCTISGGMKNNFVESAVGFDTAVKVYSQLVGNTAIDGASARKYWYFMRLMGQDPSHIALEVAMQTHPNMVLLAEDVRAKRWSLQDIVREISDVVQARSDKGKNFGTIVIPEGLVAAIPEMEVLIEEIDALYVEHAGPESSSNTLSREEVQERLTVWSKALLASLPAFIQEELCLERQSNHRVQLSQIETEKMLVCFVEEELRKRKEAGSYKGNFSAVCSHLGYQARSALPSNFDCDYAFTLGGAVAILMHRRMSGYLATVTGLKEPVEGWKGGGVPLTSLLGADDQEKLPTGQCRPRVPPTPINLRGDAYLSLQKVLANGQRKDLYRNPGPVQFAGDTADNRLMSLELETDDYLGQLAELRGALRGIQESCRPGCSSNILKLSTKTLQNLTEIMELQAHFA
ncbi:RecName: Full=Pyrophosphate--fructose 6-phosphate 1-phosphotransferase subunit beta; Short=PFP; AltName: Full=6-phosphofructokinase, pyrophosphate dependent; AltName: Full=Pyrophosphate-dependent 6-ph [Ectocarpus siliculosus]|uniref:Pyrophosphate--fructose 6-phosphate 1-phosphotransferase n=1 Tax=Ectocarpus siliculosus TaxID=2880 RepID=D7FV23_ECTSI|nr:RecName: Full=Pyrophosphate--fructose 6-phosphate 1-phosphotransferase subunit beta; Short=PFP; AltName: Full=6-phosphofructokinase, pyrophosphate dependent; AltName: Full=Pyrophosphate-dependent 6-ph [Ectocarpus siliculosus]|eukprot:CBJ31829.1 RecName: Full=Pyrophosphate--fructose 6-phosphate 1-phosphotransferase subunit beta; Short=PFP; AltName: Full=6-phosphofructokinase, pyrophosphate dependent; AltName: Full=Pyrophosphate-dependent 6-ph [Ectocarpus siliculosus]